MVTKGKSKMQYKGSFGFFDAAQIDTYPLAERMNKVKLADLVTVDKVSDINIDLPSETCDDIETIAGAIVSSKRKGNPVIVFTGAHLIKNGMGPLLVDLIDRGVITLLAGNGATAIHDFELAQIGQTSENVPNALSKGHFGMAYEFAYINMALSLGNEMCFGYGESLGKMICDGDFRKEALSKYSKKSHQPKFQNPQVSFIAACHRNRIPLTIHVGIGTDVIDQHESFDGQAKGGCSGRDFLIYTDQVTRLTKGGVVLNIGSAVTGPEVLLKAVSMASNAGFVPMDFIAADFDLRPHEPSQMIDESAACYYFRDQKSVVTRIPQSFNNSKGYYVQGNQKQTFPLLYKKIIEKL